MERGEGQREGRSGERGGVEGRGKKGRKSGERGVEWRAVGRREGRVVKEEEGQRGMREGIVAEGRCGR